jgi:cytidylate kinase
MIVTIDGPAGTGKSTVARTLAERIGYTFFDTGAMYRAVTYALLDRKIPFTDKARIEELLSHFDFRIETSGGEHHYFVDDRDVSLAIRSQLVTRHVSEVAALLVVREALVLLQRRFAEKGNAVFEGRDLGTVVFPNAEVKIFLTASPEVRAERRFRELLYKRPSEAENLTKEQVMQDIMRRDLQDSTRSHSPLKPADDAKIIDTSSMTVETVIETILQFGLKNHDLSS